jgi:hypothetical protein
MLIGTERGAALGEDADRCAPQPKEARLSEGHTGRTDRSLAGLSESEGFAMHGELRSPGLSSGLLRRCSHC